MLILITWIESSIQSFIAIATAEEGAFGVCFVDQALQLCEGEGKCQGGSPVAMSQTEPCALPRSSA